MKDIFADTCKKYMRAWSEVNRYRFVKAIGGVQECRIARKFVWKLEMVYWIRPEIRKTVLVKHQSVFNENCKVQPIMITVKAQS